MALAGHIFTHGMHHDDHKKQNEGGGSSMAKIKALRTLRLLRLLRLLRFLKGIGWINTAVDLFLKSLQWAFVIAVILAALMAVVATMIVAVWVGKTMWLREHELPKMPKLD